MGGGIRQDAREDGGTWVVEDWIIGNRIVKAVPLPTVLSTRIRPLCSSMIALHAESPKPVPPFPEASGPDFVVKNRSKIFGSSSLGIPGPLSRTTKQAEFDFGS
jgi:hypothetical protein